MICIFEEIYFYRLFYGCYKLLLHFMSFLKFLSYTHNFYQYVPSPVQFKVCPNLFVFRGEAMGLVALFKSSCLLLWKCCPLFMFNVFSIQLCYLLMTSWNKDSLKAETMDVRLISLHEISYLIRTGWNWINLCQRPYFQKIKRKITSLQENIVWFWKINCKCSLHPGIKGRVV